MPALWLAGLRQKSQSLSYGGTKESVIQNAIPAAARQAKTKPARHSAKRRLPMSTPTTSLLTMLVATAIKVARAALCADMPVSFVIETGDGVDVSKTGNGRTQDHARRTDALTDNARSYNDEPEKYREGNHRPKSEWMRNVVGVAGFVRRVCPLRGKKTATPATKVATRSAGAISHRSAGCSAATMTITRKKEIPLALATPAARTVTAVEETSPPAALDKRMPCRAPNTRTPRYPRKETPASAIAISHIWRGLTPPKGPIGSSGITGKMMNVIASHTRAERNSGQVMRATQL